jgi:acyl-CoA thioesterase FadM
VADAYTRHATVARETFRPTRVPNWLAEAIATAESSER